MDFLFLSVLRNDTSLHIDNYGIVKLPKSIIILCNRLLYRIFRYIYRKFGPAGWEKDETFKLYVPIFRRVIENTEKLKREAHL